MAKKSAIQKNLNKEKQVKKNKSIKLLEELNI